MNARDYWQLNKLERFIPRCDLLRQSALIVYCSSLARQLPSQPVLLCEISLELDCVYFFGLSSPDHFV